MMMFFLEKNMKKWKIGISVMLVLCIFMLTACGSKKSVDNKSTQNAGDCITVSIPESFESLPRYSLTGLLPLLPAFCIIRIMIRWRKQNGMYTEKEWNVLAALHRLTT